MKYLIAILPFLLLSCEKPQESNNATSEAKEGQQDTYGDEDKKNDSLVIVTNLKDVYDIHSKNKKPILLYAYDST